MKELLGALLTLLILIIRYVISSRISQKENLDAALKAQEQLDTTATQILTDALETNRGLRRKLEQLQDAMDEDTQNAKADDP